MNKLKFDVREMIADARLHLNKRVSGAQIRLPGLTFSVAPIDPEEKVAKHLAIWLADRRVLKSKECCDFCIKDSLASLQKVREQIIKSQTELAEYTDRPLYFVLEFIAQGIRQFLNFAEELEKEFAGQESGSPLADFKRPKSQRDQYFDGLNTLREHLYLALVQISLVGKIKTPEIPDYLRVKEWKLENYIIE